MANWSSNLILVDADYLDRVVFDMTVHFEPVIGRSLPQADLCHWLDCIALDGGLREGGNEVQVVFIHSKAMEAFRMFRPSAFHTELDGQAFKDRIGEFLLQSFPVEDVVSQADFFVQSLEAALESSEVERVMVVGDMEAYESTLTAAVAKAEGKAITVFSMRPVEGKGFVSEILGYSLLAALGIRSDELQ